MSREPFYREKFRRPEIFLRDIMQKGAQGKYIERDENVQIMYRAVVVAVDVEGGKLENPDASGTVTHVVDGKEFEVAAQTGPKNPQNSIKARIISDGFDQFIHDDNLRVFWPFFPEHISTPIKPGEHVYVLFEDDSFQHGIWISRIPGHEGVNYVRGQDTFKKNESLASKFGDVGNDSPMDNDEAAGESRPAGKLASLFGG